MTSAALVKFRTSFAGAEVLLSFNSTVTAASNDSIFVQQACLKAAIASAVGCWEGYLEAALREFVSKTRVLAQRRSWSLIAQFESIVDKLAADLNTPNWDKTRDLLITVTGMDPYASWVWSPKYTNPIDTKTFFDGVLKVRHAFAHGFNIPGDVNGLLTPGILDTAYSQDALACILFFATTTDALLEHELMHRHGCNTGWS
jgi:RiboL-PSP-HEPN